MYKAKAHAAASAASPLAPTMIERRSILPTVYPVVPGHEIVGRVAYERLLQSEVKHRFSIDMASLKSE